MNIQSVETDATRIVIDMREGSLVDALRKVVQHEDAQRPWFSIETACLEIGDVHIIPPHNHDIVVMERKTMQDVASSIQDGRWSEQKHRALATLASNHQLLYLIEVDDMSSLFDYNTVYGRIQYDTVMNTILNLSIRYKIPYIFLQGTLQTAQYIYRLAFQHHRQATDSVTLPTMTPQERYDRSLLQSHYHTVASQKRKNMNPLAFFRMTLQIIPGISQKTAVNIQELFEGGFLSMIDFIRDHDKETFNALYRTKYGRSLNRDVIQSLYDYVLDTSPTTTTTTTSEYGQRDQPKSNAVHRQSHSNSTPKRQSLLLAQRTS